MDTNTRRLGRPQPKPDPSTFSLGRLLTSMGDRTPIDDRDAQHVEFNGPMTARLDLDLLARDLTVAAPTGGGYLADAHAIPEMAGVLRGFSILVDAGARVVPLRAGSVGIPAIGTPTTGWLTNEGDAVAESDPAFAKATGSPKMLATAPIDVSRKLLKEGGLLIERTVRAAILTAIGRALDAAALNGSGSNGQPTGALGVTGTISQSGTSLARAGLVAMLKSVLATGVRRERLRWLIDASAFDTLARKEAGTGGSGFLLDEFRMLGVPVDVATGMPTDSLLLLDPAEVVLGLWGGIEVRINPFSFSTLGSVRFDCMVGADVLIPRPGTIAKSTSIT